MYSLEFDIAHQGLVVSCLLGPFFKGSKTVSKGNAVVGGLWIDGSNQSIKRLDGGEAVEESSDRQKEKSDQRFSAILRRATSRKQ